MVPLAGELEDLVDVLVTGPVRLVLVLDVDLNLKSLGARLIIHKGPDTLALGVVKALFLLERVEKRLRNVVVDQSVPAHLELVEVLFVVQDVSVHAHVVHQVHHNAKVDPLDGLGALGGQVLVLNNAHGGVVVERVTLVCRLGASLLIKLIGVYHAVPVVFYHAVGVANLFGGAKHFKSDFS